MSLDLSSAIIYSAEVFASIVGIIGLKKYKQFTLPLRFLEWYIIGSMIEYCVLDVMVYKKIHTYLIWQSFAVFELFLFSCVFYIWRTSRRNGFLIWAGFVIYLLIWVVGKFSFEPFTGVDNYSESITQLIQIGFGGWILLGILKEPDIVLKEDARFWVLSGIVLYAVSTFFLFGLFTPMLISNRKLLKAIWPLNDAFLVMQFVFFLRAFLCKPELISMNLISSDKVSS